MSGIIMSSTATSNGSPASIERERLGAALDGDGLHPPRARMPRDDLAVRRVVVDDEDPLPDAAAGRRLERDLRRHFDRLTMKVMRNVDPSPARSPPDRAAHQLDEALGDREPESGAAVPSRRRCVDLAERREQPVHPVRRDPDPRVAHRQFEPIGVRPLARPSTRTTTSPLLGELDGVREQVEEHLSQAGRVADDPGGRVLVDQAAELDPLLPGARSDDLERALDAVPQVERLVARARASPPRSSSSRGCRRSRAAARLRSSGRPRRTRAAPPSARAQQEVGHADHRVHRRPDLVAHRGQEGALRLGRRLGFLPGALELGDVVVDAEEADVRSRPLQRDEHQLDVDRRSVLPPPLRDSLCAATCIASCVISRPSARSASPKTSSSTGGRAPRPPNSRRAPPPPGSSRSPARRRPSRPPRRG